MNEFVIKNGFISKGDGTVNNDLTVSGDTLVQSLTASTINITTIPVNNNFSTEILVRDSSTGDVGYRDDKTIGNNVTTVTGSTYSATTTDNVIGIDSSTNTVTLYLPDSVSSGRLRYDIKDTGLNSLTNNITVLASGTDTIITSSSVSSIVLSNNGVSITLINDGSGQWWQI